MPFSILHIKIIMLQCKDLTKNGKERLYRMTNEQSIVKVERLTKRIGSKTLVENISFEVKKVKWLVCSGQMVLEKRL